MNVVVNGLMTNYLKVGKGKIVVLLPGWGDTVATFSGLTEILENQYQLLALDLPGFGGTQAPPEAWSLQDYADFVKAWVDKLAIKPFALIGHSFGGAVAITAVSNGLDVNKLILIASAGIRNKNTVRRKLIHTAAKLGKVPLYALPSTKQRKIKEKFYKTIGSDSMLLPHMEQTYRRIIGGDVRRAALKIKTPTLIIYGTMDKDTPPGDGRLISKSITGSRLEIIEAGHFLHQDQPHLVSELVEGFLKESS